MYVCMHRGKEFAPDVGSKKKKKGSYVSDSALRYVCVFIYVMYVYTYACMYVCMH